MAENVITPKFRASYPNLFTARRNDLNGKDEYSVVALFPKDADLSALKAAAKQAAVDQWGADQSKWPPNLRLPFRDQAEKEKNGVMPDGYEKGAIFMTLKSNQKPGIVDANRQPIIDASAIYAGCYLRASVHFYAYDQKGNRGVSAGLGNIQKMGDGESLSGRVSAEQEFEAVEGADGGAGASSDDPFK